MRPWKPVATPVSRAALFFGAGLNKERIPRRVADGEEPVALEA